MSHSADALQYVITYRDLFTGAELPVKSVSKSGSIGLHGDYVLLNWPHNPRAADYRVYRKYNGNLGYIGQTDAPAFIDNNIFPMVADKPRLAA